MVERCAAASLRQPRRPWGIGPDPPDRAPVGARAVRESLELRQHRLAAPRTPPRPHRRALVRHGPPGTRPVRAHALGRAALAPDQRAREPRQSRDRHLLGPVLVYAALTVPQMIVFESFLSFLGLGVQEPHASLGNLILVGAEEMESAPWMLLVPAAFLVGLLLSLNFLGDGLRDALDPREH